MESTAQSPVVKTTMMIRRPANEVFQAFIDPYYTTQFWFTKSSGTLEVGQTLQWEWEMYGTSTEVVVREIETDKRILISWYGSEENLVEWIFTPRSEEETQVNITHRGFFGSADERVSAALSSTEDSTIVLCAAKAFLEHGLNLNFVLDKASKAQF